MQSQQKKVKWSRGETADALEERTDTGITQVSVSKLENIIADIYGNISRRPAFKVIDSVAGAKDIPVAVCGTAPDISTDFANAPDSFVFTIDANTYIIFITDWLHRYLTGLLIHNNKFVRKIKINSYNLTNVAMPGKISSAQYNNFMVVSNYWLQDAMIKLIGDSLGTYEISAERFEFSAPWYAANGTQSVQVSSSEVSGMNFDSSTIENYTFTEANGETTVYSWLSTGITAGTISAKWIAPTTTYYFHCSTRHVNDPDCQTWVDNISAGGAITGGSVTLTNDATYTDGQQVGTLTLYRESGFGNEYTLSIPVRISISGESRYLYASYFQNTFVTDKMQSLATITDIESYIPVGSIVQFPNNGSYMRVEGFVENGSNNKLYMYGALLVPVVDDNAHDSIVKVELGYTSLQNYTPQRFTFFNQRLYASAFYNADLSPKQIPGYVIGSQVARYSDFKNDYNTKSEAVAIDISTAYQEQVVALIDYNGLKILTDSAEYMYSQDGGVIKQSNNGSLASCEPIVFGSVCLYADKSGGQIRAMQYELQTDLFTSSSINQMAKEDLIFNTISMAGFLDKEHYNGRFLYAMQFGYNPANVGMGNPKANHAIAVCNMVPGNQAMIWTRWAGPDMYTSNGYARHALCGTIEVNNKVWFLLGCYEKIDALGMQSPAYTLAELDYDNLLDTEVSASPTDTVYKLITPVNDYNLYAWVDQNDPDNIVYTKQKDVLQGDDIFNESGEQISTAENSPGGPNIIIGGVGYYEWDGGYYTKAAHPEPSGPTTDESRQLFDSNGDLITGYYMVGYNAIADEINVSPFTTWPIVPVFSYDRVLTSTSLQYTYIDTSYSADYTESKNIYSIYATMLSATVSVFDGNEYKWDDTLTPDGLYTKSLAELTNPRVGFMIDATLESHPIDIQGKTYTEKKRIGKAVAVIRDTEPGAFTVCDKTGYTSNDKKTVSFYGCTGMKEQVRYTIKNIQGAKFTIESLTMIIEYGTLDS